MGEITSVYEGAGAESRGRREIREKKGDAEAVNGTSRLSRSRSAETQTPCTLKRKYTLIVLVLSLPGYHCQRDESSKAVLTGHTAERIEPYQAHQVIPYTSAVRSVYKILITFPFLTALAGVPRLACPLVLTVLCRAMAGRHLAVTVAHIGFPG